MVVMAVAAVEAAPSSDIYLKKNIRRRKEESIEAMSSEEKEF